MFNKIFLTNKSSSFLMFLSILSLPFISFSNPVVANPETSENHKENPNYGLPTHRRDGGSRNGHNSCVANSDNNNLVALIPDQDVGANASNSPKLFFYIPEVKEPKTLEFVLRNEADELIHEAFLTTAGKGIVGIEIPAEFNSSKLENKQKYHWYLSMICNRQQRSRDIVVEGWMQQSSLDLATKQQLNLADSLTQAELYYEQGFWYDALATLVSESNLSNKEPVVRAKWTEFLDSVGLAEFSSESFIEAEMIETSANFK